QAVPGWKVRVITKKLATPIQTDDGPITEGIDRMVWTRTSGAGGIKPGQFQDFPISVQIPGKAGDKLTFKALQTYSNGEVVRWIGAPSADQPAPRVTVTDAKATSADHTSMGTAVAAGGGGDDANSAMTAPALVAAGLLVALGALAVARRRHRSAPRRT